MNLEALHAIPHRRYNPLTGEWVLVSPQRTQRPWQGQTEKPDLQEVPQYDPTCYLCPGNERAGGVRNPRYQSTFVFDNDFAALKPDVPDIAFDENGLIVARSEMGICRVVCFTPRHDLTLAIMSVPEIRRVVDLWADQYRDLGSRENIRYVQIFENRGAMMGASNPHPHCQIWANQTVPNDPAREQAQLVAYARRTANACILCEYLEVEVKDTSRIVCQNEYFAALVPFWAVWPFETLVISRQHMRDIASLSPEQRDGLGDILQRLTTRYDNLFEISFPYSMGFHQRPTDDEPHDEWHLHAHFYPPLLRSATVRKFMVGYELLCSPQRDITPESAAERLRNTSEVHFSTRR